MKVLHITPHLGGGVGSVLRSYLEFQSRTSQNSHKVLLLEHINSDSRELFDYIGVPFHENVYSSKELLSQEVSCHDVILIHWWNHPLLQELLMNYCFPKNRMVFWCHIAGSQAPNVICDFVLDYPDEFVFTTPLSNFVPSVAANQLRNRGMRDYIWSTVGFESIDNHNLIPQNRQFDNTNRNLTYCGNLDETKIHADFFNIFSEIETSKFHLDIVGPPTSFFDNLSYSTSGVKYTYHGFVSEQIKFEILSRTRIFVYPLARHHYGTCDQSIQEAMIFGIPVVVLNNPMESYMVKHAKTGYVAKSISEMVHYVEVLLEDESQCKILSSQAQEEARMRFSIEKMSRQWDDKFHALYSLPMNEKVPLSVKYGRPLSPAEVLSESLGIHGAIFQDYLRNQSKFEGLEIEAQIASLGSNPSWKSPTKSSISHYAAFFDDEVINAWKKMTS